MKNTEDGPILYGLLITDADLITADGKGLEGRGVEPDELLLPTVEDIIARRDPVMARAAALADVQLTAEKASDLFTPRNKKGSH